MGSKKSRISGTPRSKLDLSSESTDDGTCQEFSWLGSPAISGVGHRLTIIHVKQKLVAIRMQLVLHCMYLYRVSLSLLAALRSWSTQHSILM